MLMDPILPVLVALALFALVMGILFIRVGIPLVLAHLATGLLLGPHALGVITELEMVEQLGEVGLVILLFFLGMEMSVTRLVRNWRISVGGTVIQIALSTITVILAGAFLSWPLERSVLLGFVVSLSSTAVVLPILKQEGEVGTPTGEDVLGILLVQDLAVVPMVIVIGTFQEVATSLSRVAVQVGASVVLIGLVIALGRGYRLPTLRMRLIEEHEEMQVFAAFVACFGMATLTAVLGLSTAMGAFVGGILVAEGRKTGWVRPALEPFRVLLMALFFVAVGALLDLSFLFENIWIVFLLVAVALLSNTAINAGILRVLGRPWRSSFYGGALLSQIGEFSFVLAALGLQAGVITEFSYQTTLAVISLSIAVSPLWIWTVRRAEGMLPV